MYKWKGCKIEGTSLMLQCGCEPFMTGQKESASDCVVQLAA